MDLDQSKRSAVEAQLLRVKDLNLSKLLNEVEPLLSGEEIGAEKEQPAEMNIKKIKSEFLKNQMPGASSGVLKLSDFIEEEFFDTLNDEPAAGNGKKSNNKRAFHETLTASKKSLFSYTTVAPTSLPPPKKRTKRAETGHAQISKNETRIQVDAELSLLLFAKSLLFDKGWRERQYAASLLLALCEHSSLFATDSLFTYFVQGETIPRVFPLEYKTNL